MPIYPHLCSDCGYSVEQYCLVGDRNDVLVCQCGSQMKRVPTAPIFRMQGKAILNDSGYLWENTALEGKDMCNPHWDKRARKTGEVQSKVFVDGGHHRAHGSKRPTRSFNLNGA